MSGTMRQWINDLCASEQKRALPILSFPSVTLLGISVKKLIGDSEHQAQGMVKIAERTKSAAVVSLMDLSVEAECFGATVVFSDNEVPTVTGRIVCSEEDANRLLVPKVGTARSGIYVEAIRKAAERITNRPVFAGMIGPYSLAARLLDVSEIMIDCYEEPDMVHTVLEKATRFLIEYAKTYKAAGADGILMAEPVAGLLSPALEREFSAPYVRAIVDAVQDDEFLVIYHNCGDNTPAMADSLIGNGAAAYHFGNSIDLRTMLDRFPSDVPVMGNVDPAGVLRMGTPETVKQATLKVMNECSSYGNFVISSGCDIPSQAPWENIDAFFDAVDEYYMENR